MEAPMLAHRPQVAIVDYGLGNLFSVKQACEYVGMQAMITASHTDLFAADAVILPGVGAYGVAMEALHKLDLVEPLREIGTSDRWLIGICLGLQLLMTESHEFGIHQGLGIIEGEVVPLENPVESSWLNGKPRGLKVPQVGWNRIWETTSQAPSWKDTPLAGLSNGEYLYFVHSFYVKPENKACVVSTTQYGHIEFCSSIQYNNVFACQFHPERSGPQGLMIYQNIAKMVQQSLE
jgi:glutamine amidotransferase